MDQLAAIRAFVRVVESGNFTRAAHLLSMPKPSVSKQVQMLEQHLRTRLLNRTTRRVTVTADGAAITSVSCASSPTWTNSTGMVPAQASPKGRLRVDVSASIAMLCIIPSLPDFHARYPDIQLEVGTTDRPVDLTAESIDCVSNT